MRKEGLFFRKVIIRRAGNGSFPMLTYRASGGVCSRSRALSDAIGYQVPGLPPGEQIGTVVFPCDLTREISALLCELSVVFRALTHAFFSDCWSASRLS